jgi:hypothetical protein
MIQIILSSLILCVAMYLVARHEAEISLPITLMISVGVSVIAGILSIFIGPLALLVALGLLVWSLNKFCYLRWSKAAVVTGIYLVTNITLSVGLKALSKA